MKQYKKNPMCIYVDFGVIAGQLYSPQIKCKKISKKKAAQNVSKSYQKV